MITDSPRPLTQPIRVATLVVLAQSLTWATTGVLLLTGTVTPQDLPRLTLVIDWGEPVTLAIVNLTAALILSWLQFRATFLRRRVAGFVAGPVWIVLGLLACLPVDAQWYDLAAAVAWVFVGATTTRWAWRLRAPG